MTVAGPRRIRTGFPFHLARRRIERSMPGKNLRTCKAIQFGCCFISSSRL